MLQGRGTAGQRHGKRIKGEASASPSPFWPQELEYQVCKILPGTSLAALDDTDIETLLDFVLYIVDKNEQEKAEFVVINGKKYKKVNQFSKRI